MAGRDCCAGFHDRSLAPEIRPDFEKLPVFGVGLRVKRPAVVHSRNSEDWFAELCFYLKKRDRCRSDHTKWSEVRRT